MGTEIERKFLVLNSNYRKGASSGFYRQGYLLSEREKVVRVRVCNAKGYLSVKGMANGITRPEFEYEIPEQDANEMLDTFCRDAILEKNRYILNVKGFRWEIDEFLGSNEGLVVAEIELQSESEAFPRPDWLGVEVSLDPRYYNNNLVRHPFREWR